MHNRCSIAASAGRPRPALRLLTALVLALSGAGVLAAQVQPPAQPKPAAPDAQVPTPTFRTEANFVRVDVYPSADGRPVDDLRAEDFEVLEDGKPQKIETFEHVIVRAPVPREERIEPNTVREANQMAADARARLFVLFLDTYHVTLGGAQNIREPLVRLLSRVIGADDMVAVMTPETSAASLTFARRTTTIETILDTFWQWGRRDRLTQLDPVEEDYRLCYPPGPGSAQVSSLAQEMIDRRREQMALDAAEDLIVHLRGLREERKAVLLISEGWKLFRPNSNLAAPVDGRVPSGPGIFVGPDGKLRTGDDPRDSGASRSDCERDRIRLAQQDDERQFRQMLDDANRANVSFYPIDPRGLPVFDTPIDRPLPPGADRAQLNQRLDTLQTLAVATDGIAIINSNNIEGNLRRVVDDLTSYYLLGYYTTGKLDGKFHSIMVRVKRPGVQVRARRGYRAPTQAEVASSASSSVAPAVDPGVAALNRALGALGVVRPESPIRFRAGYGFTNAAPGGQAAQGIGAGANIWVAGELDANRTLTRDWDQGGTARVMITGSSRDTVASTEARLAPGARSLLVRLPADAALPPGEYVLRVESRPAGGGLAVTEALSVAIPTLTDQPALGEPVLFRRGPFTGAAWQPVGDLRFRRQERIRVDVPVTGEAGRPAVRLLGRTGVPIEVPVSVREDVAAGGRSIVGEVALAPLAPSDYVLEISMGQADRQQKVLAAFRIVP